MKPTSGHYWCEYCDDPAFGERCQNCGRDATWIPTPPLAAIGSSAMLASVTLAPCVAKTLFDKIRETIQQA